MVFVLLDEDILATLWFLYASAWLRKKVVISLVFGFQIQSAPNTLHYCLANFQCYFAVICALLFLICINTSLLIPNV